MRAYTATFAGAFLSALLYSTKPDSDHTVTLTRQGDTAVVIDTSGSGDSALTAVAGSYPASSDSFLPDTISVAPSKSALSGYTATGSSTPAVLPADLEALRSQGMMVPVAGVTEKDLVDSFDDKRGSARIHNALDIMAARNTPAVAATAGSILKLHSSVAGGLTIYMSDKSRRFVLMYGHLESFRPGLREGSEVKRGAIIGFVGSTGNANVLVPHLHFQVMRNDNLKEWWKGTPVNPFLIYRPK